MFLLVRLFGLAIIVMGIYFYSNEDGFKKYMMYWREKKHLLVGALISIAFGVVCLIAAPECKLNDLIIVLGIWGIVKGVLLLVIQPKKIAAYMDWWMSKPFSKVRYFGIFAVAFGILMIYAA